LTVVKKTQKQNEPKANSLLTNNKNNANNLIPNLSAKTSISSMETKNKNNANKVKSSVLSEEVQSQLLHGNTPISNLISTMNKIGTSSGTNKIVNNAKILPLKPAKASTAINNSNMKTQLPRAIKRGFRQTIKVVVPKF
jgi:hypothetical protein